MSGELALAALLAGGIGGSLALLVAALVATGGETARLRRRLARLAARQTGAPDPADRVTLRRDRSASSIAGLDLLIKRYLPRPARLSERLERTGRRIAIGEYLLASLLVGASVFALLAAGLAVKPLAALLFAAAAALWLPHAAVGFAIARRLKRFLALFPDAIELIVRGLRSGIPVAEAIRLVGEETADPVGPEFRRIVHSVAIGETLEQALAAAARRLAVPEFRFFAISLGMQRETGGNLAETLENLATILRRRRQMRLKIRALSSEARASAAIIGALPFLMFAGLYAISPDYMTVLTSDRRGVTLLAGALISILAGIFIMARMARFEI